MAYTYEEIQRMLANPSANLLAPSTSDPNSILGGIQGIGAGYPPTSNAPSLFKYTPYGTGAGEASGLGYLGANMPLISSSIQGLSQLGGLYLGIKQLGLAKKSFNFEKQAYNTNLANQTSSYNTQVSDKIAGRSYASEEERQAALRAAQLPTPGGY